MAKLELAFVLAPRQNLFFVELVDALQAEAESLGVSASTHVGAFPPPTDGIVYVLVPPHEYFALAAGAPPPSPATLKRTVFICAEQPQTPFFEHNVAVASSAGAVFDINRHAVRAFAHRGVRAEHFQLGWTPRWDHMAERERDIDILFMGATTPRREAALASYAHILHRRRHRLVLSDNSRPNWAPSENFRSDDEKWDMLSRTKVLLNIHQGESPYFEWLRIVQAVVNGAVVVSEHSVDFSPFVPAVHFVSGDISSLGLLAELMVEDDSWRKRMQQEAYQLVRDQLPLRHSVQLLVRAAERLSLTRPLPPADDPVFTIPPDPQTLPLFAVPDRPVSPFANDPGTAAILRSAKHLTLEALGLRRRLARIELRLATGKEPPPIELVRRSRSYSAAPPRISVLTALYNHAGEVTDALNSLITSRESGWEAIVVDDGSTDGSGDAVERWIQNHEYVPALLLRHPVNRGLGHARNSALGFARGEYCLILDADNEIRPNCLSLLTEVLDGEPEATFAYGIIERFGSNVPGLVSFLPWDPVRFRVQNYIDALSLIRVRALRDRFSGYTTDPRLHGWEDFDLWCRIAEAGGHGTLVPEIVARYRTSEHSMISTTNVSVSEAFSVLIERNPTVMAGLKPPA